MKKLRLSVFFVALLSVCAMYASPYNIAPQSRVSASSVLDDSHKAENVTDRLIRTAGKGEWASKSRETFWGEIDYPWIQLDWDRDVCINQVVLYDRPDEHTHTLQVVFCTSAMAAVSMSGR